MCESSNRDIGASVDAPIIYNISGSARPPPSLTSTEGGAHLSTHTAKYYNRQGGLLNSGGTTAPVSMQLMFQLTFRFVQGNSNYCLPFLAALLRHSVLLALHARFTARLWREMLSVVVERSLDASHARAR